MIQISSIIQKFNIKIIEARGFWGWIKLVLFAIVGTWILMSFNLIFDLENSAPLLVVPFLWVVTGVPSAYICYVLSKIKKRTLILWVVLGFLFNIFAITAIFAMPESTDSVF